MAAMVIDTSLYNVHQLQAMICDLFGQRTVARGMMVTFLSFGYSQGVPREADLVMDVRFLPNPYFVEELKALPGTDPRIGEYLLGTKETQDFLQCFQDLLRYLLPLYEREGKAYLTVAVGCTGGKHRSVVIAAELAKNFEGQFALLLCHRDLETSS